MRSGSHFAFRYLARRRIQNARRLWHQVCHGNVAGMLQCKCSFGVCAVLNETNERCFVFQKNQQTNCRKG